MKSAHHGQLMLSIGALLAAEREKRGIPVEKAAKETRMRPQRIRDMESDDLSHFTNPSYARMFIIAYAKYLGVPMQTICDHLPDRGEPGTEGYQYISTSTENLPSLRHDIASKPARRSTALYILAASALVLVLAVVIGITYVVINADRLTKTATVKPPPPEPVVLPPREIVKYIVQDFVPTTLQSGATIKSPFDDSTAMQAPPTPAPPIVTVKRETPALTVTLAPAPAPSATPETLPDDDHAFLLGSSPDPKPSPVP
jgi:cytoskeletal protein RodZ